MRFEWTQSRHRDRWGRGNESEISNGAKDAPTPPFCPFSRSNCALFSSTSAVSNRTNAPARRNRSQQQVHLARIPLPRRFLPVPWPRWSDFRGSFSFSFSENGTAKSLCLDLSSSCIQFAPRDSRESPQVLGFLRYTSLENNCTDIRLNNIRLNSANTC